ncbi:hypothetical protein [Streptomyces cucumeris]|uniref:hypothetical protein n=1 Tax=Streptomyces cucumeris TaxID=2962890 RepID=UPI003D6FC4C2
MEGPEKLRQLPNRRDGERQSQTKITKEGEGHVDRGVFHAGSMRLASDQHKHPAERNCFRFSTKGSPTPNGAPGTQFMQVLPALTWDFLHSKEAAFNLLGQGDRYSEFQIAHFKVGLNFFINGWYA